MSFGQSNLLSGSRTQIILQKYNLFLLGAKAMCCACAGRHLEPEKDL